MSQSLAGLSWFHLKYIALPDFWKLNLSFFYPLLLQHSHFTLLLSALFSSISLHASFLCSSSQYLSLSLFLLLLNILHFSSICPRASVKQKKVTSLQNIFLRHLGWRLLHLFVGFGFLQKAQTISSTTWTKCKNDHRTLCYFTSVVLSSLFRLTSPRIFLPSPSWSVITSASLPFSPELTAAAFFFFFLFFLAASGRDGFLFSQSPSLSSSWASFPSFSLDSFPSTIVRFSVLTAVSFRIWKSIYLVYQ